MSLAPPPANIDVNHEVDSLASLRDYIHSVLCARENLLPDQFELQEFVLRRGGEPCGLQFLLNGLRSIRLSAVWAAEHHDVYFYGARGERFRKVRLTQRFPWQPAVDPQADAA